MEFVRQEPSARFTVPDKITVRQQMAYFSVAYDRNEPTLERWWQAAVPLISEWTCELMPDPQMSLDEITDPAVTDVLIWAGITIKNHVDGLGAVKKN